MAKTIFYSLAALVRKILFCHSKIKFISSRHRVISSIYFIGGGVRGEVNKYLSDVDRYNLDQNTWEKVADMREKRMPPCGAAAHGKIFIVGGNRAAPADTCEVYNEQLNEW